MPKTKKVSFSEVDTYRQCPLKHYLAYKEGWSPPEDAEALTRGSLFHSVMELHYDSMRQGLTAAGAVQTVNASGLLWDPETAQTTDMQENVAWMYKGYVEEYGGDEDWEILAVEKKFGGWLPTTKGTRSSFRLVGTIDLVVRDNSAGGGIWIVDHKTCKNLPKGKDLDLDDQMGTYLYLLRRWYGIPVRGAIYNSVRHYRLKTREMGADERFQRELTIRSDEELETMAKEVYDCMRDAYSPSDREVPRRTPDQERCGWKCSFTEPCLASRGVAHDEGAAASTADAMQRFGFIRDERGTTRKRYEGV